MNISLKKKDKDYKKRKKKKKDILPKIIRAIKIA